MKNFLRIEILENIFVHVHETKYNGALRILQNRLDTLSIPKNILVYITIE